MADYPLTAAAIKNEFKRAGIHFVVALPDRVTSHHLLKGLIADPDYKVVQVCKEDEGVSICSGLYAAGHKSVLMMQYTGFLDSINSIRGIAVEGKFPVCIVVGLLGKEPDVAPVQVEEVRRQDHRADLRCHGHRALSCRTGRRCAKNLFGY